MNILVKGITARLVADVNYAAAQEGWTQREWVIWVLSAQFKKGVEYGDEQRAAKGSGAKDHGKVTDDGRGDADVRDVDEEAGGLRTAGRGKSDG